MHIIPILHLCTHLPLLSTLGISQGLLICHPQLSCLDPFSHSVASGSLLFPCCVCFSPTCERDHFCKCLSFWLTPLGRTSSSFSQVATHGMIMCFLTAAEYSVVCIFLGGPIRWCSGVTYSWQCYTGCCVLNSVQLCATQVPYLLYYCFSLYTTTSWFLHLLFHILGIVLSAVMNIGGPMSFQKNVLYFDIGSKKWYYWPMTLF